MASTTTSTHMSRNSKTRNCKENALDFRDFELFVEGTRNIDDTYHDYYGLQARFIAFVCGRLGLRPGELAHLQEDWIDWREKIIEIPSYEACTKGRKRDHCGFCEKGAKQLRDTHDHISLDEARDLMWTPKTDMAIRGVPFGHDPRTELVIERFFEKYDGWPLSQVAINRRVNKTVGASDELSVDNTYPHALRATAATNFVARGLETLPLQTIMGWEDASTAKRYVSQSTKNVKRHLQMMYSV